MTAVGNSVFMFGGQVSTLRSALHCLWINYRAPAPAAQPVSDRSHVLQDPSSGACTDELVQLNASNWNWSVVQVRGMHLITHLGF